MEEKQEYDRAEFPEDANILWKEVEDALIALSNARSRFLHNCDRSARNAILKNACSEPTDELLALSLIDELPDEEALELLCPLLRLVVEVYIDYYPRPGDIILELPRDQVLSRIGECIELIKQKQDYDQLDSLLYFLERLDHELTLQTAYDLTKCESQIVRQLGEECVRKLQSNP